MSIGKLYNANNDEMIAEVEYQMQNESPSGWWGELVLIQYKRISDGSGYLIELEDSRQGHCSLKKRVNRAVSGVPPRYIYHFSGTGKLKKSDSV